MVPVHCLKLRRAVIRCFCQQPVEQLHVHDEKAAPETDVVVEGVYQGMVEREHHEVSVYVDVERDSIFLQPYTIGVAVVPDVLDEYDTLILYLWNSLYCNMG